MFWIKYRHLSDGSFPNMNIHATLNPKKKNKTQQPSVGLFSSPKLFIHAIRHIKHIFLQIAALNLVIFDVRVAMAPRLF